MIAAGIDWTQALSFTAPRWLSDELSPRSQKIEARCVSRSRRTNAEIRCLGVCVMSMQIRIISFVAPMGIMLLIGMQAAEAKQCSAAEPSNPQKHWSYRLIDGRKCWYEGENNFPKSLLQWPEQTSALSAFGKVEPSPEKEGMLSPATQTMSPPAESNNQSDFESFEARWRALGLTRVRN
jgi:hypothetical protein